MGVFQDLIWLIVLMPLVGFLINGAVSLLHRGEEHPVWQIRLVSLVAPGVMFVAFLVALGIFFELSALPVDQRLFINELYTWIGTGALDARISFQIDQLSMVMTLIVTGVGFLIHLYSVGYMRGEKSFARYFAWLNLFTFAMLLLVLGDNLFLMFIGWEGVGLCSYLLIGFWHKERANAIAGMKAFIVNRIGDFAFLVGFFLLFWGLYEYAGSTTVTFRELPALVTSLPHWLATTSAILLFIGATGKSAQIPLYVWLPDAMAGPTPVSALIHAATMVTSGIYMIARMSPLFILSPEAMTVIAVIAVLTALISAIVGLTQFDIKKVLAYSTVSQLGFMFLAMGIGAFHSGIFHLMTHAFFKGLLFLGSGSVIMAMHHEQDMRKMGGLRKKIPITFYTFLIGTIAISGLPGLSGFFSKDEILYLTFMSQNTLFPWLPTLLWAGAALTAGITAFYMFRLLFMTFFGEFRGDHHTWEHMHESPKVMTIPLIILAALSIFGGYLGVPTALGGSNLLHQWLAPVLTYPEWMVHFQDNYAVEYTLMALAVLVASSSIALAWYLYLLRPELPPRIAERFGALYRLVLDAWRVDQLYDMIVVRPTLRLTEALRWIDIHIVDALVNRAGAGTKVVSSVNGMIDRVFVDGLVNSTGRAVDSVGGKLRSIQSGSLQSYFYYIAGTVAVIASALLFL